MARRQEQGRGSFGRDWSSPPGNLYLSVLLRPTSPLVEGGLWSLLSAVALAEAVGSILPDPRALRLKWPNDLLLNGAKLAGILLDSTADSRGNFASLVIGIGVNIATKPDLPDRTPSCLADLIAPPAPDLLAHRVLASLAHWIALQTTRGFAPIRDAWLTRGPASGTVMHLSHGASEVVGTFAGLAENGSILIEANGYLRSYAAGEIRLTT
jgi:BirA family biotin operon repressor/biotin-[acetyl-CoA-carboxylase] ligase